MSISFFEEIAKFRAGRRIWARIAVATQNILREEAHLCDVIDPLGGSYYVERLTDQMEDEILRVIMIVEDAGGMYQAVGALVAERAAGVQLRELRQRFRDVHVRLAVPAGLGGRCRSGDLHDARLLVRADPDVRGCADLRDLRLQQVQVRRDGHDRRLRAARPVVGDLHGHADDPAVFADHHAQVLGGSAGPDRAGPELVETGGEITGARLPPEHLEASEPGRSQEEPGEEHPDHVPEPREEPLVVPRVERDQVHADHAHDDEEHTDAEALAGRDDLADDRLGILLEPGHVRAPGGDAQPRTFVGTLDQLEEFLSGHNGFGLTWS
ncbi:methylmalonyl-CoA mutase family protein [Saccharopolyspora sp. NPDC002376]